MEVVMIIQMTMTAEDSPSCLVLPVIIAACEESLKKSALWSEVKDRLDTSALGLSGGQQ